MKTIRSNIARFLVGLIPLIHSQALLEPAEHFSTIAELINTGEQMVDYLFRTYPCVLMCVKPEKPVRTILPRH